MNPAWCEGFKVSGNPAHVLSCRQSRWSPNLWVWLF